MAGPAHCSAAERKCFFREKAGRLFEHREAGEFRIWIFHELIWPQMQGAACDAVAGLLRACRNTADAGKAARPKGEFFRHKNDSVP